MQATAVVTPTQVVALIGGPGSGKSTVAEHLTTKGFVLYSISEIRRVAGLVCSVDVNDFEAMRRFTENFYAVRGRGVFAEYALLNVAARKLPVVVLEGLRYRESISVTRAFCAKHRWSLLCIGLRAPAATAAARIATRGRLRDPRSPEAIAQYAASTSPNTEHALEFCDVIIDNDGTVADLFARVDEALAPMLRRG